MKIYISNIYFCIFSRATLHETFTATPLSETTSIPVPFTCGVPPSFRVLHSAFSVLLSATEYPCWFAIQWHILRWKGGPNQAFPINNTEQQEQQEKRKKKTVKKCALSGITIDDKMELRRRFSPFALNVNSNSLYIINMVIRPGATEESTGKFYLDRIN